MLPVAAPKGNGKPGTVALAALELPSRGGAVPAEGTREKLQAAVNSMATLFGGYHLTPGATWADGEPVVLAFLNVNCALAFAAGVQDILLHTPWSEQVLPPPSHPALPSGCLTTAVPG